MSQKTAIEWTDVTWNFLRGCSIVSPGCINCYAMGTAHRFSGPGLAYEGLTRETKRGPVWTGEVKFIEKKLYEPLGQKKPQKWFVNSMSDLFHEDVDDYVLDKAFAMMAMCPNQIFQILTKRPERMLEYMGSPGRILEIAQVGIIVAFDAISKWGFDNVPGFNWDRESGAKWLKLPGWPLPNVWLGVSVENKDHLERVDILKDTTAAVRFISFEPLLEDLGALILDGISWAIVGGESGHGARWFNLHWARVIREQCWRQGVAFFYKQGGRSNKCEHSSAGAHLECIPPDLAIRQFPEARP